MVAGEFWNNIYAKQGKFLDKIFNPYKMDEITVRGKLLHGRRLLHIGLREGEFIFLNQIKKRLLYHVLKKIILAKCKILHLKFRKLSHQEICEINKKIQGSGGAAIVTATCHLLTLDDAHVLLTNIMSSHGKPPHLIKNEKDTSSSTAQVPSVPSESKISFIGSEELQQSARDTVTKSPEERLLTFKEKITLYEAQSSPTVTPKGKVHEKVTEKANKPELERVTDKIEQHMNKPQIPVPSLQPLCFAEDVVKTADLPLQIDLEINNSSKENLVKPANSSGLPRSPESAVLVTNKETLEKIGGKEVYNNAESSNSKAQSLQSQPSSLEAIQTAHEVVTDKVKPVAEPYVSENQDTDKESATKTQPNDSTTRGKDFNSSLSSTYLVQGNKYIIEHPTGAKRIGVFDGQFFHMRRHIDASTPIDDTAHKKTEFSFSKSYEASNISQTDNTVQKEDVSSSSQAINGAESPVKSPDYRIFKHKKRKSDSMGSADRNKPSEKIARIEKSQENVYSFKDDHETHGPPAKIEKRRLAVHLPDSPYVLEETNKVKGSEIGLKPPSGSKGSSSSKPKVQGSKIKYNLNTSKKINPTIDVPPIKTSIINKNTVTDAKGNSFEVGKLCVNSAQLPYIVVDGVKYMCKNHMYKTLFPPSSGLFGENNFHNVVDKYNLKVRYFTLEDLPMPELMDCHKKKTGKQIRLIAEESVVELYKKYLVYDAKKKQRFVPGFGRRTSSSKANTSGEVIALLAKKQKASLKSGADKSQLTIPEVTKSANNNTELLQTKNKPLNTADGSSNILPAAVNSNLEKEPMNFVASEPLPDNRNENIDESITSVRSFIKSNDEVLAQLVHEIVPGEAMDSTIQHLGIPTKENKHNNTVSDKSHPKSRVSSEDDESGTDVNAMRDAYLPIPLDKIKEEKQKISDEDDNNNDVSISSSITDIDQVMKQEPGPQMPQLNWPERGNAETSGSFLSEGYGSDKINNLTCVPLTPPVFYNTNNNTEINSSGLSNNIANSNNLTNNEEIASGANPELGTLTGFGANFLGECLTTKPNTSKNEGLIGKSCNTNSCYPSYIGGDVGKQEITISKSEKFHVDGSDHNSSQNGVKAKTGKNIEHGGMKDGLLFCKTGGHSTLTNPPIEEKLQYLMKDKNKTILSHGDPTKNSKTDVPTDILGKDDRAIDPNFDRFRPFSIKPVKTMVRLNTANNIAGKSILKSRVMKNTVTSPNAQQVDIKKVRFENEIKENVNIATAAACLNPSLEVIMGESNNEASQTTAPKANVRNLQDGTVDHLSTSLPIVSSMSKLNNSVFDKVAANDGASKPEETPPIVLEHKTGKKAGNKNRKDIPQRINDTYTGFINNKVNEVHHGKDNYCTGFNNDEVHDEAHNIIRIELNNGVIQTTNITPKAEYNNDLEQTLLYGISPDDGNVPFRIVNDLEGYWNVQDKDTEGVTIKGDDESRVQTHSDSMKQENMDTGSIQLVNDVNLYVHKQNSESRDIINVKGITELDVKNESSVQLQSIEAGNVNAITGAETSLKLDFEIVRDVLKKVVRDNTRLNFGNKNGDGNEQGVLGVPTTLKLEKKNGDRIKQEFGGAQTRLSLDNKNGGRIETAPSRLKLDNTGSSIQQEKLKCIDSAFENIENINVFDLKKEVRIQQDDPGKYNITNSEMDSEDEFGKHDIQQGAVCRDLDIKIINARIDNKVDRNAMVFDKKLRTSSGTGMDSVKDSEMENKMDYENVDTIGYDNVDTVYFDFRNAKRIDVVENTSQTSNLKFDLKREGRNLKDRAGNKFVDIFKDMVKTKVPNLEKKKHILLNESNQEMTELRDHSQTLTGLGFYEDGIIQHKKGGNESVIGVLKHGRQVGWRNEGEKVHSKEKVGIESVGDVNIKGDIYNIDNIIDMKEKCTDQPQPTILKSTNICKDQESETIYERKSGNCVKKQIFDESESEFKNVNNVEGENRVTKCMDVIVDILNNDLSEIEGNLKHPFGIEKENSGAQFVNAFEGAQSGTVYKREDNVPHGSAEFSAVTSQMNNDEDDSIEISNIDLGDSSISSIYHLDSYASSGVYIYLPFSTGKESIDLFRRNYKIDAIINMQPIYASQLPLLTSKIDFITAVFLNNELNGKCVKFQTYLSTKYNFLMGNFNVMKYRGVLRKVQCFLLTSKGTNPLNALSMSKNSDLLNVKLSADYGSSSRALALENKLVLYIHQEETGLVVALAFTEVGTAFYVFLENHLCKEEKPVTVVSRISKNESPELVQKKLYDFENVYDDSAKEIPLHSIPVGQPEHSGLTLPGYCHKTPIEAQADDLNTSKIPLHIIPVENQQMLKEQVLTSPSNVSAPFLQKNKEPFVEMKLDYGSSARFSHVDKGRYIEDSVNMVNNKSAPFPQIDKDTHVVIEKSNYMDYNISQIDKEPHIVLDLDSAVPYEVKVSDSNSVVIKSEQNLTTSKHIQRAGEKHRNSILELMLQNYHFPCVKNEYKEKNIWHKEYITTAPDLDQKTSLKLCNKIGRNIDEKTCKKKTVCDAQTHNHDSTREEENSAKKRTFCKVQINKHDSTRKEKKTGKKMISPEVRTGNHDRTSEEEKASKKRNFGEIETVGEVEISETCINDNPMSKKKKKQKKVQIIPDDNDGEKKEDRKNTPEKATTRRKRGSSFVCQRVLGRVMKNMYEASPVKKYKRKCKGEVIKLGIHGAVQDHDYTDCTGLVCDDVFKNDVGDGKMLEDELKQKQHDAGSIGKIGFENGTRMKKANGKRNDSKKSIKKRNTCGAANFIAAIAGGNCKTSSLDNTDLVPVWNSCRDKKLNQVAEKMDGTEVSESVNLENALLSNSAAGCNIPVTVALSTINLASHGDGNAAKVEDNPIKRKVLENPSEHLRENVERGRSLSDSEPNALDINCQNKSPTRNVAASELERDHSEKIGYVTDDTTDYVNNVLEPVALPSTQNMITEVESSNTDNQPLQSQQDRQKLKREIEAEIRTEYELQIKFLKRDVEKLTKERDQLSHQYAWAQQFIEDNFKSQQVLKEQFDKFKSQNLSSIGGETQPMDQLGAPQSGPIGLSGPGQEGQMGRSGPGMGGPMPEALRQTIPAPFSQNQLQQLRAQIAANRFLSRNEAVPFLIRMAAGGQGVSLNPPR